MFNFLKKYSFVVVIMLLLVLTACNGTKTTTTEDLDLAKVAEAKSTLILGDLTQVKANLTLPTAGRNETTITWESSNTNVLSNEGVVTRPEHDAGNVTLTLTATITLNDASDTKEFEVRVIEEEEKVGGTIASVLEQSADTIVTIDEGIVFALRDKGYYVYDGTGFIYVYNNAAPTVSVGDKLLITGKFVIFFDEPEIKDVTKEEVISTDNALPTPVLSTIAEIVAFDLKVKTNYAQYLTVVGTVVLDGTKVYITDDNSNKIKVLGEPETVSAFVGKKVSINVVIDSYHSTDLEWRITFANNAGDITEIDMSEQEALNTAVNNLTYDELVYDNLSLPTTIGDVTVVWTTDNSDVIATDGTVTRPLQGESDVTVKLTATLTIGALTNTKEFTLVVKAINIQTIAEARAAAVDTDIVIKGIVTGLIGNNIFLQDGTAGIYVYVGSSAQADFVVGNEVTIAGTRAEYKGLIQLSDVTAVEKLSEGNALPTATAYTTIADLLAANLQSQLVTLTEVTITELPTDLTNGGSIIVSDGTDTFTLRIDKYLNPTIDVTTLNVKDVITVTAPLGCYTSAQIMLTTDADITVVTVYVPTDADKVQEAIDSVSISAEITSDLTLETDIDGVTVAWVSDNVAIDATTGAVTRPANGSDDVTVTLTATFTLNEATQTITYTVIVKEETEQGAEEVIYQTGFESETEFTASTVYNNSTPKAFGPDGGQWSFVSGTPSTTGAISGSQSAHMRWYDSAPTNLGYIVTNFTLTDVTKVEFLAANTSNVNVIVSYSTDGTNFIGAETFTLTTTATTYTYNVNATGDIYLKFELTFSDTTLNKSRLYIDDVVVYG